MIEQLSLFTENRRGAARKIFGILAGKNINVLCLCNSDSGEFGTMRLILSDTATAAEALKSEGYLVKADHVLAAELDDRPGSLESLLAHIEEMQVNIDYMYVGYMRESRSPVIVVRCDDMDIVEQNLRASGYSVN